MLVTLRRSSLPGRTPRTTRGDRWTRLRKTARQPSRWSRCGPQAPTSGFFRGTVPSVRDIVAQRELLATCSSGASSRRATRTAPSASCGALIRPLTQLLIYYVAIGKFLGAARVDPRLRDLHLHRADRLDAVQRDRRRAAPARSSRNCGPGQEDLPAARGLPAAASSARRSSTSSIQLVILLSRRRSSPAQFPTRRAAACYFPLVARRAARLRARRSALLLSAVNVYLRDIQYLVEVVLMVCFWASPIVYSWSCVSDALAVGARSRAVPGQPGDPRGARLPARRSGSPATASRLPAGPRPPAAHRARRRRRPALALPAGLRPPAGQLRAGAVMR